MPGKGSKPNPAISGSASTPTSGCTPRVAPERPSLHPDAEHVTWFMRDRDVRREIERRKRQIQALGRLKSKKVVMRGEQIVTAYPSQPDDQKRTLRRGRRKGLAT